MLDVQMSHLLDRPGIQRKCEQNCSHHLLSRHLLHMEISQTFVTLKTPGAILLMEEIQNNQLVGSLRVYPIM